MPKCLDVRLGCACARNAACTRWRVGIGPCDSLASRVPAAHQLGVLVHPDRIVHRDDGADLALMTNVVFPELRRRGATSTTARAARATGVASRYSAPSS